MPKGNPQGYVKAKDLSARDILARRRRYLSRRADTHMFGGVGGKTPLPTRGRIRTTPDKKAAKTVTLSERQKSLMRQQLKKAGMDTTLFKHRKKKPKKQ